MGSKAADEPAYFLEEQQWVVAGGWGVENSGFGFNSLEATCEGERLLA